LNFIKNFKTKFGDEATAMQVHWTPGAPQFKIVLPNEKEKFSLHVNLDIGPDLEFLFTSLSTQQFYLANMAHELSKCMDGANIIAYKEMTRVIRFVLDTRDACLKLKPTFEDENRDLVVFIDSDWAGDVKNPISVIRFSIYLLRATIC
jgi:hypothetical protein